MEVPYEEENRIQVGRLLSDKLAVVAQLFLKVSLSPSMYYEIGWFAVEPILTKSYRDEAKEKRKSLPICSA